MECEGLETTEPMARLGKRLERSESRHGRLFDRFRSFQLSAIWSVVLSLSFSIAPG